MTKVILTAVPMTETALKKGFWRIRAKICSITFYSSCNASAGCTFIALRAGIPIPMTIIRVISTKPVSYIHLAKGASFLIGDAGISIPRIDIVGMRFIYYLTIYDLLFNRVFIGDIAITLSLKLQM